MPHYSSCDVLRHFDAFVCLPLGDTLPCHGPRILRQPSVTLSAITTPPVQFTSVLPVLDPATNRRSNPIAHRVRRKRQRLPPSLLIENASDRYPLPPQVCPEAFPIKASDNPEIAMVCGRSRFSHYRLAGRSLLDDLGKLVSSRGYSGGWKRCTRIVRFEKHVSNYLIIDWLLVRKGGFEPPRLSAPPPQDGVSASSTTSAG